MTNNNNSKKVNKTVAVLATICAILFGISVIAICLHFNKAEEIVDSNGVKLADYWIEKIKDNSGRYILHVQAANENFDVLACEISVDPSFDETQKFTFGAKAQSGDTSYTNEVVSLEAGSKLYLRTANSDEIYTLDVPADKKTKKAKKEIVREITTNVVEEKEDDKDDDRDRDNNDTSVKITVVKETNPTTAPTAVPTKKPIVKITKVTTSSDLVTKDTTSEGQIVDNNNITVESVIRPVSVPVFKPTNTATPAPSAKVEETKKPEETVVSTAEPTKAPAASETPKNTEKTDDRQNSTVINKVTINETVINKETINETVVNKEIINETVKETATPAPSAKVEETKKPVETASPAPAETKKPEETVAPTAEPTKAPAASETPAATKKPHKHHYKVIENMEAKCLTDGHKTFECECGSNYTETIPAHGHNMKVFLATEEYIEKHCKECGYVEKVYAEKNETEDKTNDNKTEDEEVKNNNTDVDKDTVSDKVEENIVDDKEDNTEEDNAANEENNVSSDSDNENTDNMDDVNSDDASDGNETDDIADDAIVIAGPR